MSKKADLKTAGTLLLEAAERCEYNAAVNNDEGNWSQENLNRQLAKSYREGAAVLEKAAK
jgi:hypothetical protein